MKLLNASIHPNRCTRGLREVCTFHPIEHESTSVLQNSRSSAAKHTLARFQPGPVSVHDLGSAGTMTRNLGSERGDSVGSYIDLRFSCQTSHDCQPSSSDGSNSEDYIDLRFPGEHETDHVGYLVEKLNGLQPQLDAADSEHVAKSAGNIRPTTEIQLFTNEFKEMRFPRVSADSLKNDIEDFYTDLAVGLDSLLVLGDSFFLSNDFLQESVDLLQTVDNDVRILLEKLAELRGSSSVEFSQALLEYDNISGKTLEICNALTFSMTLLKAYQSSQAEASVVAVEALVSLPKGELRAVHVVKAREAGHCLDRAQDEMIQMQEQVQKLVESGNYGSLSYFVPNLNIMNAQSDFARWYGLWGVLFALKTAASYISQLLLAGLAHASEGPALILASTNMASCISGWASSLVGLHIHVRKQFNKMQDSSRGSCSFMSQDNDRLEIMLQDTKGHLQSLLDQGKFLNIGAYLGSWQADKKKLMHNVPQLRYHLLLVRDRLSQLSRSLDSLARNMIDGQQYLTQF